MTPQTTWARLGQKLLRALGTQALRQMGESSRPQRRTQAPHGRPESRPGKPQSSTGATARPEVARGTRVLDTTGGLPNFRYDPEPDGDADPGEVCWTWVPYEEDATRGKDRPVLVLARYNHKLVVAQMTSKDHTGTDEAKQERHGRTWMDVGTGAWDKQRRPSEVRLDRLLVVDPAAIRREGATLPKARFDAVVARLRELHEQ